MCDDYNRAVRGSSVESLNIDKDDVWDEFCIKAVRNVIELREHGGEEFYFLFLFIVAIPMVLALSFYHSYGYFGWFQASVCLLAFVLLAFVSIKVYRAPRTLRLFLTDKKIVISRSLFAIRHQVRPYNLSNKQLDIVTVSYETYDADEEPGRTHERTSAGNILNLLWSLVDFVGPFVHILREAKRTMKIKHGYALVINDPEMQMIAIFSSMADIHDLIEAAGLKLREPQAEL